MEKTGTSNWKRMSDSLVVPALTIRIPMPKGVAVPPSDNQERVVSFLAASAEVVISSDDE